MASIHTCCQHVKPEERGGLEATLSPLLVRGTSCPSELPNSCPPDQPPPLVTALTSLHTEESLRLAAMFRSMERGGDSSPSGAPALLL